MLWLTKSACPLPNNWTQTQKTLYLFLPLVLTVCWEQDWESVQLRKVKWQELVDWEWAP